MSETDALLSVCARFPDTAVLFSKHGTKDFSVNIKIANTLRHNGFLEDAIAFYGFSFDINPKSADVLLAKLTTQLEAGVERAQADLDALERLNRGFYKLLLAKDLIRKPDHTASAVLEILGDAHESFYSGSEVDWIFLNNALKLFPGVVKLAGPSNSKTYGACDVIPKRIFFYWDKEPPDEVQQNISYHRNLGTFEVVLFNKTEAVQFLGDFYGGDCKKMFMNLRHPSEESDFFRFHVINAFGGYYLDTDDQIISLSQFDKYIGSQEEAIFIMSSSGPVHSAFFGAVKNSPILDECIRILMYNCFHNSNLSMWLKTGPGPITRALVRQFYRNIFFGSPLPSFNLLTPDVFPAVFRAVEMPYRSDSRDWRIFEKERA